MYQKIVVCIDDSPLSEKVIQVAADLSVRFGACLLLLCVVDPARMPRQSYSGLEAVHMLEQHSHALSTAAHRFSVSLTDMGVTNRQMIVSGRSVETILRIAEEEAADLIILGSNTNSRWQAWLNQDLWSEVSHKSRCNVLRVTPHTPTPGKKVHSAMQSDASKRSVPDSRPGIIG